MIELQRYKTGAITRLRTVMVVMGATFVVVGLVTLVAGFDLFALVAFVYGATTALWGFLLSWSARP